MHTFKSRFLSTACSAFAGMVMAGSVLASPADAYPQGPIKFVVAYTPGSANDMIVRLISPGLGERLKGVIVVDNKPGAGGSLGTTAVAEATPDGQVLGLGSTATMSINPVLLSSIRYDPLKDFTGVAYLASTTNVLVVPGSSPAKTVDELRGLMAKQRLNYSSPGNGTTQHLTGVLFANQVGKAAEHVPFKGPAEAITALSAGHVDYGFASLASAIPQIKAGRIRALAVTSGKPVRIVDEIPSISSFGFTGFEKTDVWFGVIAPSGTPQAIVEKVHRHTMETVRDPAVREKLVTAGYDPVDTMSAGDFQQWIKDQAVFWKDLVKQSGATVD